MPYDLFIGAFLSKISEYELMQLDVDSRMNEVDDYLKRALTAFRKNCKYDLFTTRNDTERRFDVEVANDDIDELVEIISEGMVVQWLRQYVNQQELMQTVLNSRDWQQYSPAELLMRVGNAYRQAQSDFLQMIRDYSYNHGDLSDLHI